MATAKQFELMFQLTARLGPNFSQSFKNASKTMNALQSDLRNADQKLKDVSAYQKQQQAVANSKTRVSELQAEHERLTREIEQTGQATPELTRQLQANEKALQKAQDATAREEERLQELSDTLREAGVNTDNLGRDTDELRQQYERLEQSQKKVQEITEKQAANKQAISQTKAQLGGLIGTVTALGTAIYAGPVKNAQEFQTALKKVETIADTDLVPMAKLRQEIINLSNETGKSANDLAEDVYNAISAGQSTADAVGFVENATKLATAGYAESGQALDVLSTILNAYGMEASKVTDVSDMLIQIQNKGKTTVADLSSSMGKIIPTANANNVALEQLGAGYATLTSKGIATAEATTYMNGMLNELGKSGSQTDKILRSKTGKSFSELMKSGYSLADVLQIVQEDAESSGKSLSDMFSSSEAGKAALSIMSDGVDTFNASVQGMLDSCGATQKAYDIMMNNAEANTTKAKNSIKNLGIVLGDMLLPYVEQAAGKVAELATKFTEFAQENPQVIATVAKVAAGLAGLKAGGLVAKLGFLQVKGGILSVQKAFTIMSGIGIDKYMENAGKGTKILIKAFEKIRGSGIVKTITQMGGGFGGILTKVAPLVGVIAAVGGAIYYVSTHLEQVRGFIQKTFGDEGLAVFDKLWGIITQVGTAIKDAFFSSGTGVLNTLKSILPTIITTLQTGLLPLLPMIADLIMQIVPLVGQLITAILPVLGQLISALLPILATLIAEILPIIVQLISTLLPIIMQIVQSVLPVFIQLVNTIVPILIQIIQAILPVIIQLIQTILPIITQIIDTVLPVFISLLNTVVQIFQNIIQAILPVLSQLLQALIPVIQLVAEIFASVLGSALQSIANIVSNVMQIFQGLIDFITGVFTGNWSQAWEGIKSIFSGAVGGLGEIIKAPLRAVVSAVNTVIGGLNKLKVPDWVPGLGGKGINIPLIPGFAKGTERTPSTFIAGENGPELITNAANRKVFTAAQTGQIFNNMAGAANLNTANNVNATAGAAGTITIHVTNSPSVTVTGGGDTSKIKEQLQQYDEEFLEKLRDIIRAILKEQKEQEGRVAYA